jgi:hypothetical protein
MRTGLLAACLGGFALLGGAASAAQIFVSNVAFSDGSAEVSISDFDGPGGPFVATTTNAGRFALTANPGTAIGSPTSVFGAWCVDVFRGIAIGPNSIVYTIGALTNDAALPAPNALSAAQQSRITGLAVHGDTLLAPPGDQTTESAAIQMAIWQTLYPTAVITSSNAAVQSLFTTLVGTSFAGSGGNALQNFNDQGQIVAQTLFGVPPGGDPFEVPAPAALGLFGLALASLFAARRARA